MQPDSIIDRYTGSEVEIIYLTDSNVYRDKGTLTDCDGEWLVLIKPGGEEFLIPVTAVRIVKVLQRVKDEETLLLRPVDPMGAIDQRGAPSEP